MFFKKFFLVGVKDLSSGEVHDYLTLDSFINPGDYIIVPLFENPDFLTIGQVSDIDREKLYPKKRALKAIRRVPPDEQGKWIKYVERKNRATARRYRKEEYEKLEDIEDLMEDLDLYD